MKNKLLFTGALFSLMALASCDITYIPRGSTTTSADQTEESSSVNEGTSTQEGSSTTSSSSSEAGSSSSSGTSSSSESSSQSSSSSSSSSSSQSSSSSSSSSSQGGSGSTTEGNGYYKADLDFTLEEHKELGVFGIMYGLGNESPTIGSPKFLVIPMTFSNGASAFTSTELSRLEAAYHSTTLQDEGAFYSLSEYYRLSSYGRLNLDLTIVDQIRVDMTESEYISLYKNNSANLFTGLFEEVAPKIVANGVNLADYDSDGDGYIDGIHFIYKANSSHDAFWNYTDVARNRISGLAAQARTCFFSSYSQIGNGIYGNLPDTHTLIHETGHMIGVDDYYSYSEEVWEAPAGGVDMMDLNIGDHNAYSKMLLGWTDPYVVDGTSDDFEITLRPFEDSGDCIVLRNTSTDAFNDTPFDEYLTLSYYTPTLLNELDSEGYAEWVGYYGNGATYSQAGLQVFHVDSRLVNSRNSYIDPTESNASSINAIAASNTYDFCLSGARNYRLIEAVPATGEDLFAAVSTQGYATPYDDMGLNSTLFGTESYHGSSSYTASQYTAMMPNRTTFNDGTSLEYDFEVTSMDADGLTVRFTRRAGY